MEKNENKKTFFLNLRLYCLIFIEINRGETDNFRLCPVPQSLTGRNKKSGTCVFSQFLSLLEKPFLGI